MATLKRSAAICVALLALPVAAVVAFHAREEVRPASVETHPTELAAPELVIPVEQPANEPARKATLPDPAVPVAAIVPAVPLPAQVRDYAVGHDENRGKAELASSDPAGVERPALLEMKALSRPTEEPPADEP
jgi:hypothetical protein